MRRRLNIHVLAAYALVTLALAYFGVMASRHIALPGLNVDEVLGVRPAVGGPVARRIFGIPVLTISYIGALKSYIYFPIFALFGGSPETIRLPTIFISLLTLALTFKLSRLHFRPSYSALLVLFMAADPIFIFMSKADYGPIVLMMFFKMLALYFFFLLLRTSSPWYLWGLTVVCALAAYDKLNFIWFLLALIIAAVVVFRSDLHSIAEQHRARFIWPTMALLFVLAGGILAALPQFLNTQPTDRGPVTHAAYLWRVYLTTMNSKAEWFLAPHFSRATLTNWVTLPIIGLVAMAGAARLIRPGRSLTRVRSDRVIFFYLSDRVIFFYIIIFTVIFAQLLITVAATNPNHVFVLYLFLYILLIAVANRASEVHGADSLSNRDLSDI